MRVVTGEGLAPEHHEGRRRLGPDVGGAGAAGMKRQPGGGSRGDGGAPGMPGAVALLVSDGIAAKS